MILPGGWSPFFCIFFGVCTLIFMSVVAWRQRDSRRKISQGITQKYELHSTPTSAKEAADHVEAVGLVEQGNKDATTIHVGK